MINWTPLSPITITYNNLQQFSARALWKAVQIMPSQKLQKINRFFTAGFLRKMSRNIQNDTTTWLACLPAADQVVKELNTTLLEMNANIQQAHG